MRREEGGGRQYERESDGRVEGRGGDGVEGGWLGGDLSREGSGSLVEGGDGSGGCKRALVVGCCKEVV